MTATAVTTSIPTTASHRAGHAVLVTALLLVAAIAAVLTVLLTHSGSSPTGTGGAQPQSNCHPTAVVHFC
jgi:microcystin-dependent protein